MWPDQNLELLRDVFLVAVSNRNTARSSTAWNSKAASAKWVWKISTSRFPLLPHTSTRLSPFPTQCPISFRRSWRNGDPEQNRRPIYSYIWRRFVLFSWAKSTWREPNRTAANGKWSPEGVGLSMLVSRRVYRGLGEYFVQLLLRLCLFKRNLAPTMPSNQKYVAALPPVRCQTSPAGLNLEGRRLWGQASSSPLLAVPGPELNGGCVYNGSWWAAAVNV